MRRHRSCFPRTIWPLIAPMLAGVVLAPTTAAASPAPDRSRPPAVDSASGNTVTRWSTFIDASGIAACAGPTESVVVSRLHATLHVAASDALNAISPVSRPSALLAHEPAAYARAAVASAARTSLIGVLRSTPRLPERCARAGADLVERTFEISMTALPERPSVWVGVVLGKSAGNAAVSWTARYPIELRLAAMRVARAGADSSGLSMWESAALLADCSTVGCNQFPIGVTSDSDFFRDGALRR